MVPTLFEIVKKQLARDIVNGTYYGQKFKIYPPLSNQLLAEIRIANFIRDEQAEEISDKMIITEIDLEGLLVNKSDLKLISKHCLDTLKVDSGSPFQYSSFYSEDDDDFDFAVVMDRVLNQETKESLRHLNIKGNEPLGMNWASTIGPQLPSLETLDIAGRPLFAKIASDICYFFSNIKVLNMSGTACKFFPDFAQMQHLDVLILRNTKLKPNQSFDKLFMCKQLRFLDISQDYYNERNNNIEIIASNLIMESLPNLRFLDASSTDIKDEHINKLTGYIPNLAKISLVASPKVHLVKFLKHLKSTDSRQVEFLNCHDIDSTIDALQYYLGRRIYQTMSFALDSVFNFMDCDMKEKTWKRLLGVLLETGKFYVTDIDVAYTVNLVLTEMFENPSKALLLSSSEIHDLLNTLMNYIDSNPEQDCLGILCGHKLFWSLIQNSQLLEKFDLPIFRIARLGVTSLTLFTGNCNELPILKFFWHIMIKQKNKKEIYQRLLESDEFMASILTVLDAEDVEHFAETARTGLEIVLSMVKSSNYACKSFLHSSGAEVMTVLSRSLDEPALQVMALMVCKEVAKKRMTWNYMHFFYTTKFMLNILRFLRPLDQKHSMHTYLASAIITSLLCSGDNDFSNVNNPYPHTVDEAMLNSEQLGEFPEEVLREAMSSSDEHWLVRIYHDTRWKNRFASRVLSQIALLKLSDAEISCDKGEV
uniref:Zer-1-like leucine-rich repeats region domain-containing protein n=1 Tax=Caenorhabditis japonica TaxID=281687 RepID=A0A8R1HXD8_CAEJA